MLLPLRRQSLIGSLGLAQLREQRRPATSPPGPAEPPVEVVVEFDGHGGIVAHAGRTDNPDLVVSGPPRLVLGLVTGTLDRDRALAAGVQANGQLDVLNRL